MQAQGEGFIVALRPLGEGGALVHVLSEGSVLLKGYTRLAGGKAGRVLQPGVLVSYTQRVRTQEQLGRLTLDVLRNHPGRLLGRPGALLLLGRASALLAKAVPENMTLPGLFRLHRCLLEGLETPSWLSVYAFWELDILAQLGYGLDLTACAVTGASDGLAYVSPRTGRAVAEQAVGRWRERLFVLPKGWLNRHEAMGHGEMNGEMGAEDIRRSLRITGHFLSRHFKMGPLSSVETLLTSGESSALSDGGW